MKVAILGTGFGQYGAAPVYRKLGFEVEVVTPRDEAAVERALASDVDLVSIHSPPFMHYEHVMRAIDHGHAVLCDKPFGRNAKEAHAMRDRACERGVLNFTNFELRSKPSRAKIKEIADAGVIGVPRHLSWSFFSNGFRGGTHGWVNERESGGGWIGAYASHLIDFTRWLFGSEVAKCGGISRIDEPTRPDRDGVERTATAEDAYSAWFVMANGCTAVQDTAYAAAAPMPSRITLMGTAGAVELVGDVKLVVRRAPDLSGVSAAERIRRGVVAGEGDEVFDFPPPAGEAHEPALTPWFARVKEALRTGRQIAPSFDDGVAVAEAMDQLRANLDRV
ncbi:Gfo/Idh/MocA family protein [Mycobacterium branderi]|uniref:Oxidoreductase n=1 Tax=Mycobacterium branderi TaxID=43348 RepID=A0A7I7WFR0_9MYCO|nr:Gfo/Idh/MocA family oxidoreductase [Mycobacterium branderi]MCV7234631.1 Gfo/Idh/MocA family oxidoreductase [Mycobacterium branderi]ORA33167.1 oxidoreductase [Mycobacterium branderi]BBZ15421.1 oxidoreductase [Mycobacterium branderi]